MIYSLDISIFQKQQNTVWNIARILKDFISEVWVDDEILLLLQECIERAYLYVYI